MARQDRLGATNVVLSEDLLVRLEAQVAKERRTRSAIIRLAIEEYLERGAPETRDAGQASEGKN